MSVVLLSNGTVHHQMEAALFLSKYGSNKETENSHQEDFLNSAMKIHPLLSALSLLNTLDLLPSSSLLVMMSLPRSPFNIAHGRSLTKLTQTATMLPSSEANPVKSEHHPL
jgi:hypothetical protein